MALFDGNGGWFDSVRDRISDIDVEETAETVGDYAEDVQRTIDQVGNILKSDPTTPPILRQPVKGELEDEAQSSQTEAGGFSLGSLSPAVIVLALIGGFIVTNG